MGVSRTYTVASPAALDDETFAEPLASEFDQARSEFVVFWSTGVNEFKRHFVSVFSLSSFERIRTLPVDLPYSSLHTIPVRLRGSHFTVCLSSGLVTIDTESGEIAGTLDFPGTQGDRYSYMQRIPGTDRYFCVSDNAAFVVDSNWSMLGDPFRLPIDEELYDLAVSSKHRCLITCTGKTHVWSLDDLDCPDAILE